jgi:hypothetical protein
MNLSAHLHLNQPYDFKESLGRTGYESTGLTCFCHQIMLTCLRNSVLLGLLKNWFEGYPRFVR